MHCCLLPLLLAGAALDTEPAISAADLAARIEVLASDAFEGRAPATPGGERTEAWLVEQFRALGLEPGYRGEWLQAVPLVATTPTGPPTARVERAGAARDLVLGRDVMVVSTTPDGPVRVDASDVVFVGYGITAPEADWDDYAGVDVRGKTVLCLVNDPGFATQDPGLFRGNAMTYYGRWPYKYEEAARHGAAACLVIHEEAAAGYPWQVVNRSWGGTRYSLERAEGEARLPIEGWITQAAAQQLVADAGGDLAQWTTEAARRGFRAKALGARASIALDNSSTRSVAHNVVARLAGRTRPDEVVLFGAHWDHLGKKPGSGKDEIFNGAHDNASGTAGLVELAEAFAALAPRHERTLLFVAFTAEESGLLGSLRFAADPPVPAGQIVAGVNMDGLNHYGPMQDLVVVGYGASELEELLAELASAQGRTLSPETTPEKGAYYRSDHFNLAKVGVPMLYAGGGTIHREHGAAYVTEKNAEFLRRDYHQPSDEFDPAWDLRGAVEDLRLFYALGRRLANGSEWPQWLAGNEFRAVREASRADRSR